MAKEHHKTLRQEFGTQEADRRLLVKECSRLKTRVDKVEGTMKETLELVDKLQAELDEAHACKLVLENRTKTAEDQVSLLHRQVLDLQAQADEVWATSTRVIELEAEL